MTYEEWKQKFREANDEVIAAGKKLYVITMELENVEGVSLHEVEGFILDEQKRTEREIEVG